MAGKKVAHTLLAIHADYPAARAKVAKATGYVRQRHQESIGILAKSLAAQQAFPQTPKCRPTTCHTRIRALLPYPGSLGHAGAGALGGADSVP